MLMVSDSFDAERPARIMRRGDWDANAEAVA